MKNYNVRNIEILSNTINVQSVKSNKAGVIQAIFYKGGTIVANDLKVTVDNPCALMLRKASDNVFDVFFSDPSQKLKSLSITVEYGKNKKEHSFGLFAEDNVYRGKTHQTQLLF